MAKLSAEKYNILLIILIFVIPLIALNGSYLFISKINFDWDEKEQKTEALHEVETLAAESDFSTEFAIHFRDYFDAIKNAAQLDSSNNSIFSNQVKQSSKRIFESPFPKYNLYVFKIPNETKETELVFYEGSISTGKKSLCKAFEYIYNTNIGVANTSNEIYVKTLLGKITNINAIAKEMRGITTNTNGIHKSSWFIWDYEIIKDKGVYGAILLCNELKDHAKYGRHLALKRLKSRGKAIGAFVPVWKEYGDSDIQSPLDQSNLFKEWADSLTIKDKEKLDYWLINMLPQNHKLGNYSAFCYLERNSSHIAIVLVKSKKIIFFPKWLVILNFIILFTLLIILYLGIFFDTWPQLNLRTRFVLSYALASVVPFCLLCAVANGYLIKFENTSEELENNKLQLSLRDFDSCKLTSIREYRTTFSKVINDPKFIELINSKGIKSELVTDYVVRAFEKDVPEYNLPIMGVKIYDETGEGAFSKGLLSNRQDTENIIHSFYSVYIDMLRDEILKDNPGIKLKDYKKNDENELARNAFFALTGRELKDDINNHFSLPIPRENGDFCGYQIFDIIKINGKAKYMLLVLWDDKALDDILIQKAIDSFSLKKNNQNFIAYKVNGVKIKPIGKTRHASKDLIDRTRHASKDLIDKTEELVKESSYFKKIVKHIYKDNIIVVMPSLKFNQIVFVGWINKIGIIKDLFKIKIAFIIFFIVSLFILWICSLRSSYVFLKPITLLKKALDEVSSGNLNIGFKNDPKNELGKLSNELGKMTEELREKERLSKLISDQAVQALKRNSSGLLNDTETFKAVALVSDIRNFTGMSEKYDPVIITELLNEHFAEMSKIISDNGGLIYKFIGDAIEAIFPENIEYDKSASERAFIAACMMITKLKFINSRRKKLDLFPYKIGVGLSYGTLHSGTVGSLETRLDYSILGDPLKNAAKYEALSIQNPDFPIIIDENIADKLTGFGLGFKKIDSKGQYFNVYTLDEIGNISNSKFSFSFSSIRESILKKNEEKKEEINYFSLSNDSIFYKNLKNWLFYSFLVLFISLLITFGVNTIYSTTFDSLKSESNKYANRLIEQLRCDDVFKSSFETLCLEFYDDLNKIIVNENTNNLKYSIEQVASKYEKLGVPIPKYCCCLLEDNKLSESERILYKGFSIDVCKYMFGYSMLYKEFIDRKVSENEIKSYLKNLTDKSTIFYNLHHGVNFRRSSPTLIDKEEILFDVDRIYDKNHKDLIAYIFCGMPEKINKDLMPNYYTLLADKQTLMAIKNDKGWYYSQDFPEKEKELLKKNQDNIIYYKDKIYINNELFSVYIISKDLLSNYYSTYKLITFTFLLSIIVLALLFWFIEKNKLFIANSIAAVLRKDIFLSAIMPILTVCFVSYLYVDEEAKVKKTEMIYNLNNQIDDIESRELYYRPLCDYFLNNLPNSKKIKKTIKKIIKNKDESRNNDCVKLSNYLKNNLIGRRYQKNNLGINSVDSYFELREILLIGKDDWIASAALNGESDKKLSAFGDLISKVVKTVFFEKENKVEKDNNKFDRKGIEGELVSEKILEILSSGYGNDIGIKITNFPNNVIIVTNSFASIGLYLGCFPDINNPDYVMVGLVFFENDFKSNICNKRNDNKISYKAHLASGSKDDKLFCFYSPNINVGNNFFYDNWYRNDIEERQTVKELGLISSWINSSYLPLSKKIDINGTQYLEARQGNIIKDNVYAAIGSDYPIKENTKEKFIIFVLIIFFSLIMVFLISQSIIYDLLAPVKQLIIGAIEASKGNYKFRTDFSRKDEFGTLCLSFDKMMKGLEEKQLMNRMVSKTALKVASNISKIQSKKENVVLVYISIPGFDKIMKNISPYELFTKLRRQIASIAEIIINNGGDIDKIMGEKLLIAFHINNNDIKDVAIKVSKVAHFIATNDKLCFNVSVGVNCGQVISGYLGVGEKRDFTIIGDPVNVTARIDSLAEKLDADRCLVSESIYNYICENVEAKLFGEVELKGKSVPMKVYQLI